MTPDELKKLEAAIAASFIRSNVLSVDEAHSHAALAVIHVRNALLALYGPNGHQHNDTGEDICGFCGQPGADKVPHPVRWPGEAHPESELVHAGCEQEECRRAHANLSDKQRRQFIKHC